MAKTVDESTKHVTPERDRVAAFSALINLLEPLDKDARSSVVNAAVVFFGIYVSHQ